MHLGPRKRKIGTTLLSLSGSCTESLISASLCVFAPKIPHPVPGGGRFPTPSNALQHQPDVLQSDSVRALAAQREHQLPQPRAHPARRPSTSRASRKSRLSPVPLADPLHMGGSHGPLFRFDSFARAPRRTQMTRLLAGSLIHYEDIERDDLTARCADTKGEEPLSSRSLEGVRRHVEVFWFPKPSPCGVLWRLHCAGMTDRWTGDQF